MPRNYVSITRFPRATAILPVALAAAFGCLEARAQPFTSHLDPIEDAIEQRYLDLPEVLSKAQLKQRKALEKCLKGLERPGTSVEKDLALAGKIAKTLDGTFPGDPEFGAALDGSLGAFRVDLGVERDRLAAFLDLLPASERPRIRGEAGLESLEALLGSSDGSPVRAKRALLLRKAQGTANSAWKVALDLPNAGFSPGVRLIEAFAHSIKASHSSFEPGRGRMACTVDGEPFVSHATQAYFGTSSHTALLLGTEILDPILGRNRVLFLFVPQVVGKGTYPLGFGSAGDPYGVVEDLLDFSGGFSFATSTTPYTGTLTITEFDPERELIAGTFSFTAFSTAAPPEAQTRTVTSGSFHLQVRWDAGR